MMKCAYCRGTGVVVVEIPWSGAKVNKVKAKPCPKCGGSGRASDTKRR